MHQGDTPTLWFRLGPQFSGTSGRLRLNKLRSKGSTETQTRTIRFSKLRSFVWKEVCSRITPELPGRRPKPRSKAQLLVGGFVKSFC